VIVGGSYAKSAADDLSDLDLTAIVERDGDRYRTWFQDRHGARPLHVSAGVRSLETFLERRMTPAGWWLGLPVLEPARYAWVTPAAQAAIGDDPTVVRPGSPPELEDFFEFSVKVKRAVAAQDPLGIRVYALAVAELAPRLLLPLNDQPVVSSRLEAAHAAVNFAVAPAHWSEDLACCLGLTEDGGTHVGEAALRLARELLAFLRERKPDVDPLPDLVDCLLDGSFERQLAS
jgi:hypothetical protein